MKKILFLFVICVCLFCLFSCEQGTGILNPHMKRTVIVKNETPNAVHVHVYEVLNTSTWFNGSIDGGNERTFLNVSECNVSPPSSYDWKLVRETDASGNQIFRIKNLEDNEKIQVTVYNELSEKVTLKYAVKADGKYPEEKELDPPGTPRIIRLYNTDYEFELKEQKLFYKKIKNGSEWTNVLINGEPLTLPALPQNSSDSNSPPEWDTNVTPDKMPLFFTIEYDKAKKTIHIKPSALE
ncbi:hypothetical protein H0R92_07740 [Treponema sp. OMZ 840]|uniref:hypothetical protein n=1 Tax=Treponema sp. OMZ 840 TaxID=244313 RepID=UPI003D935EE6